MLGDAGCSLKRTGCSSQKVSGTHADGGKEAQLCVNVWWEGEGGMVVDASFFSVLSCFEGFLGDIQGVQLAA